MNELKRVAFLLSVLLSIAPIALSCTPHISRWSRQEPRFAFVIPCEWEERRGICLLGKYDVGVSVSLLEVKGSRICTGRTSKTSSQEWIDHQLTLTEISLSDKCGSPDLYSVAVLGSETGNYEILQLKEITDERLIRSLDAAVRQTTVLQSLRMKAQSSIPGEVSEIQNDLPKLFYYPNPKIPTLILGYDESGDEYNISGPRIILFNSVPYPLTGWCSYPFMRAFRLNDGYYLESGSYCCGCGVTIKELFRIDSSGLIEVHSDSSLSD
jgi:hypothetical protein